QRASLTAAQWNSAQYAQAQTSDWLFVAEQDGAIVGFLAASNVAGESELLNMAVKDNGKRQGIGSALVQHFIAASSAAGCARVLLEVRASNAAAIRLYEKHGFRQAGIRKNYYSNPSEDALLFSLSLRNSS